MTFVGRHLPVRFLSCCLIVSTFFSGCARFRPHQLEKQAFLERAETKADGDLHVTVAPLSSEESKQVFGVSIAQKGIQAIWLKIENAGGIPYIFLPRSLDPHYYTAEEAAFVSHYKTGVRLVEYGVLSIFFLPIVLLAPIDLASAFWANWRMDGAFREKGIHSNVILPGKELAGFVFTNLDEGTREIHVELSSDEGSKRFVFFTSIPGILPDYEKKDLERIYLEQEIIRLDEAALKRALEELPCCTTDKKGSTLGDPLNVVIVGELPEILIAFAAAKWDETEPLGARSAWKTVKSFLFGRRYKYSPVSSLYFSGRAQDIALQKVRYRINERLHLRLWYTSMRLKDKPVWIGQASRDIGIRFTLKTWTLTTHKIDSNVDELRDYVLADLTEAGRVSRYGYVPGVGEAPREKPRENLTGDPYHTDGMRLVLALSSAQTELNSFHWSFPAIRTETPQPGA